MQKSGGQNSARKRAPNACDRCRQQKIRCRGGFPCDQCTKKHLICTVDDRLRKILVTQSRLSELEAKVAFYEGNFDASAQPEVQFPSAEHPVSPVAVPQQQCPASSTTEDHDPQANSPDVNDTQVDLRSSADIPQDDFVPPVQLGTPVTPAISRETQIPSETRSSSLEPRLMNPLALGVSTYTPHVTRMPAFGKAFLARTSKSGRPAGGDFFVQAMAILPDVTFLCLHPIETIEILCCATLYLHSLDYRSPAYQLIGQALRIALDHGMHTSMESQHVPQALVQRCRKIWWTVYVLDRQLSSLMGVPSSIRDEDISAELPLYLESPYRATALDIQVKLSRAIAKISNNVYGREGRLKRQYVSHIKEALKDIAHITDQLHTSFELSPDDSDFGVSRLSAYLHVLHHQCIILATRPLLYTLLEARLQSRQSDHRRYNGIKPLVIMCIESAFQNLKILAQLQEENLLECFLSFDLDAAFSSAVILLMGASIDSSLLGDEMQLTELSYQTVFDHRTCTEHSVGEAALEARESSLPLDPKVALSADIEAWRKGTLDTIDLLGETDYLAVKLTGAGPEVTKAFAERTPLPKQMLDALEEIAVKCRSHNARILVDAESQRFQWGIMDATIDLMRKFNRDGRALVYNTYQAYLKSTPTTLEKHLTLASEEGFTLGLKLVRGAYINSDERSLIHDTKQDTDNAYNTIAQGALSQQLGAFGPQGSRPFPSVNLFLASHNKQSVFAAHNLHQKRLKTAKPTVPVGYAQLQGMSDQVSFGLLKLRDNNGSSPEVFKCSTWGTMSNLGAPILSSLVDAEPVEVDDVRITRFIACTRSEDSQRRLEHQFHRSNDKVTICRNENVKAVHESQIIVLAVDPSAVHSVLTEAGLREALGDKLLISVAAGWTRQKLEATIYGDARTDGDMEGRACIVRTLPNIAAQVSQSLTAIEISKPSPPTSFMAITESIFQKIGKTVQIEPKLMDATTALGGSTPAFFAVICDALVDAAVAVGVPRSTAHVMTFQAMQGTAALLQSGIHPALLKDQGTSPEGCTIGGLMVMEEAGVRGHIGRALREAVTIARRMDDDPHVNDTRH
ncbi:hypothetical protein QM012_008672 [Aureobasidium pullulans]|uniref:proline dehydrogenase n=1 Tax=Aureobasidium pullulans TaxID=5580 RepID=A0ABR0TLK5_AURPU